MLSMEHSKEELHFLSKELASKTDEFSDLMESEQGTVCEVSSNYITAQDSGYIRLKSVKSKCVHNRL